MMGNNGQLPRWGANGDARWETLSFVSDVYRNVCVTWVFVAFLTGGLCPATVHPFLSQRLSQQLCRALSPGLVETVDMIEWTRFTVNEIQKCFLIHKASKEKKCHVYFFWTRNKQVKFILRVWHVIQMVREPEGK